MRNCWRISTAADLPIQINVIAKPVRRLASQSPDINAIFYKDKQ